MTRILARLEPDGAAASLPRALRRLAVFALLALAVACGGDGTAPEPTALDRETFITTWVELRVAAVESGSPLTDSLRAAVLERQGVTEEELLAFAEARGDDLEFMRDLWAEVEARLQNRRVPAGDSIRLY